ncbi:MAG TPA: hypothetical protein PKM25_15145, partial [Candidatus Ozemobacteraceae bacterium]|nr:hypothetical protein [Candidatus Ozemobacteraceae bacterium]
LLSLVVASAAAVIDPMSRPWQYPGRNVERRDILGKICEANDFSLVAASNIRGTVDEVASGTIEQVLDQALKPAGFDWRFWENCLYVGSKNRVDVFFEELEHVDELKFRRGRKINGIFRSMEVASMIRILRKYSETNIVMADTVSGEMSLRLMDVPWERVLMAVVYLNGLKLVVSDFSIMVVP